MKTTKVFCIGFHKTGTTSLGKALELMGYKHCHGGSLLRARIGDRKLMESLFRKEYELLFSFVNEFDSINDSPWFKLYKELDVHFPDSKFILMLRDESTWIESCRKFFTERSTPFRLWIYGKGSPHGNGEKYLRAYREHNQSVVEYFADRAGDLLIVNLEDPDKTKKISAFLNFTGAEIEYPHLNRT